MIRLQSSEEHGLDLAAIKIDGGTQSRANVNQGVVNDYAEAIKAGADFPPIVVFYDGKKHWLADGFHRFHAYQKLGREKVAADVRQGTRRDAILHSVGANEAHGLRRTRDDKRRAVLTLLNDAEWGKKPETWIAETCRVSRTLVRSVLDDHPHLVEKQDRSTVREVTRGGRTYAMQTANIGKAAGDEEGEAYPRTVARQGVVGGDKAENRVSESCPADPRAEAEHDADAIQSAFDRASDEGRALFLTRNNLESGSNAPASPSRQTDAAPDESAVANQESVGVKLAVLTSSDPHEADESGSPIHESPSNRDVSADGEASPLAGPQAEASPSREQETGTLAGHEGRSEGEAASVGLPTNSDPRPNSSPAVEMAGEPQDGNEVVSGSSAAESKPRKHPLRPHCLHPYEEVCAGYGTKHCQPCLKAMQDNEAA